MKSLFRTLCCFLIFGFLAGNSFAQQKMDEEYAKLIKKYTTDSSYLNDMIDHLPASSTVPSPLDFFGTIAGAADTLHYSHQIYDYFRALEKASPRISIRNIGKTEEGRDMLIVLIADEATINNLDTYRGYLNDLADPRRTNQNAADAIIPKAKPIYYMTAGLHSPETGSPEMVMELAYRLIVGESPFIKNIRSHIITAITPVAEPDGRDRVVDIYNWRDAHNGVTPGLTYWGHYVAHDNNRDGYGLGLNLTRNILGAYLHWKPTVMHDLHESVPYLYVSIGMGPYNPYYSATLVDAWNKIAYKNVGDLTSAGMPGVWTWGYYTGWASSFLFSIANNRNSVGRFFETFGNGIPQTVERELGKRSTSQEWYRMNPPLEKTQWSLRNNVNYSQAGVLSSLEYTANNDKKLLRNFYNRSKETVMKGKTTAPYAFVIPKDQRRDAAVVRLVNLLRTNGIEVQQTDGSISWKGNSVKNGAYVVRMDQPYRAMIGTLLDVQKFPSDRYPAPYDDVGWTLPYLYQIKSYKVEDPAILQKQMALVTQDVKLQGGVDNIEGAYLLLNNTTENQIAMFRLQLPEIPMQIAEQPFNTDGRKYAAGSLIIATDELSGDQSQQIEQKAEELGIDLFGVSNAPDVGLHDANVPRVALVHTWIPTPQNAGWWRLGFDKLGIPYELISTQDFKDMDPNDFDVIIIPDSRADTQTLVMGSGDAGMPIPWMTTELTPNLGKIDHTTDQRQGMTYDGVNNLVQFVHDGGVLITDAGSSNLPIDLGIIKHVRVKQTQKLATGGSIFSAVKVDSTSPIAYGYPDTMAVYFNNRPVFSVDDGARGFRGYRTPDWVKDEQWQQTYPRVIVRFNKDANDLLLSGMVIGGKELAGAPAVVDAPSGKGHVIMFAPHTFWRWETQASHALIFNTILNWDDLRTGWPERPEKE